ncbi:MAG TPA: hypothetical protein VNZ61_05035 [Roseomonas sp.]|nr:hypothetical protein [Roseomonas sp.]
MSTHPSLPPAGHGQEPAPEQLEPFERELLHSVAQRALRQLLDGTRDRSALLAQMRTELGALLQERGTDLPACQDLLLAELEAMLTRLGIEPAASPPAG